MLRQSPFLCSRFDLSAFGLGCFYIFGLRHVREGATRANEIAEQVMKRVREAVGLR